MEERRTMAKNAIFNIIYKILNVIFPLISATYVARVILPSGVGSVSYAQNIVSYFTMLAALGIPTYGVRKISQCRDSQIETNKAFSELMIINGIATTICLITYGFLIIRMFEHNLNIYIICGLLIVFNYINVDWFYQGKEEYVYIAVRSSIIKGVSILLLLLLVRAPKDYIIYALITTIATGGNYVFNIVHIRKYVSFTLKELNLKQHMKPILYMVVCVIAAEFYSKIDITMLGGEYDSDIVGYYSNAQKLINLVTSLPTAITTIFLPRLSYYYNNDRKKYTQFLNLGFKILCLLSVPSCVGLVIVADSLVPVLFGTAFMPAVSTARTLAPLILIKSFGDLLCYQVIISSGNEKRLLKSYFGAAVANVVLNALLIPQMAQNGAALASVTSELLLNATLFLGISSKIIKLKVNKRFVCSIAVGTMAMVLSVFLIGRLITNVYVCLIVQVIVGILAYLSINLVMKNEMICTLGNKVIRHKNEN